MSLPLTVTSRHSDLPPREALGVGRVAERGRVSARVTTSTIATHEASRMQDTAPVVADVSVIRQRDSAPPDSGFLERPAHNPCPSPSAATGAVASATSSLTDTPRAIPVSHADQPETVHERRLGL